MTMVVSEILDAKYVEEYGSMVYTIGHPRLQNLLIDIYHFNGQWCSMFHVNTGKYKEMKGLGEYLVLNAVDNDHTDIKLMNDWLEKCLAE